LDVHVRVVGHVRVQKGLYIPQHFLAVVLGVADISTLQSFGTFIPSLNDYQAPAPWQSAISQSPSIGSVFGVYWGGYLNDRFGYRKSLIINYIFVIPCIGKT
jgi:MFS family permease